MNLDVRCSRTFHGTDFRMIAGITSKMGRCIELLRYPIRSRRPMGAVSFAVPSFGQNSDFNLNVHANSHVTAKDIGLPAYPGATPFKNKDSNSSSPDLLFLLNSFHFSVKAASFVTTDSPEHVLEFYRKPLAKFGEVLECDHGKPVGSLTVTNKRANVR